MALLERLNDLIWGIPLLTLLMGTHIYFTLKLHFPQRNLLYALKLSLGQSEGIYAEFVYYLERQTFCCAYKVAGYSVVDIMVWQIDHMVGSMICTITFLILISSLFIDRLYSFLWSY